MVQVRCYEVHSLQVVQPGIALTNEGMISLGQATLLLPNISTVRAGRLEAMPVSNDRAVAVIVIRATEGASWELVRPYPSGTVVSEFPHAGEGAAQASDALIVAVAGHYDLFVRQADGQAYLVRLVVSGDRVELI
jgi:hypothetical protein